MSRRALARLCRAALTGGALLLAPLAANAQPSLEYAVKAAYLTKFIPFVVWPADSLGPAGTPFQICLLGADPFQGQLQQAAAGQRTGDHPLVIRQIGVPDVACQMVFITLPDAAAREAALAALAGRTVLTVTDSDSPQHGIISFAIARNTVRFDIDDNAAAASGLAISSKLLDLARNVRRRGAP